MKNGVSAALDKIDMTYEELIVVANDILADVTGDLDAMMDSAYNDVERLSNEAIRDLMLKLSLRSYSFSEIKEKSIFKATLGETLRKEAYATNFNSAEGTVAVRENNAILNTSDEIVAEEIYTLVSSLFKTKLDEVHRVVATLQSVLMSRMQEAKLSSVRTMSAADFATSVPVIPIAIPISAALREGASLTPSPVMETMFPLAFKALTI